jgi:hypothetical protein
MTAAKRQRLARILGMLGSEHAGERASAALQAEAFRKRHGLTWEQMLSLPAVPMEQWARPAWVPPEPRPKAPEPPPPPPPPPRERRITPARIYGALSAVIITTYFGGYALIFLGIWR